MLLRNPISHTKRFFQRTLQTVKSIFSTGGGSNANCYHKIPPLTSGVGRGSFGRRKSKDGFERLYVDYNGRWEKKPAETRAVRTGTGNCSTKCRRESTHGRVKSERYKESSKSMEDGGGSREERRWFVERKLKEMAMVDVRNMDHVLDIEEVLHYYSRLSCPEYLDIVDKFFMDVYAEFFPPAGVAAGTAPVSVSSRSVSRRLLPS